MTGMPGRDRLRARPALRRPREQAAAGPARREGVERGRVRALVVHAGPGLLLRPPHLDRLPADRPGDTSDAGSLRSPTMIASVGQTVTHAGSSPMSRRCAHRLHFSAEWSSGLMKIASYGQAAMHALQPMQIRLSKSTMPSSRRYIASRGAGRHARRVLTLVAPGHLERAPRQREGPHVDGLDIGPGHARPGPRSRSCTRWCTHGSRCTGTGRAASPSAGKAGPSLP